MVDPWEIYLEISRFTYNGCSLVDYAVASAEMLNKIAQFTVHALTSLSNNCAISCSIITPTNHSHAQPRSKPNLVNYFLQNVLM